jgi:enoyl-[acyl-carrier protein] reductase III
VDLKLRGKKAIVTGGTRGIGRAVALRLARDKPKHIVLGYSMNHSSARSTVAELQQLGVDASAVPTDVGDPKIFAELFKGIEQRFGRLDVFVSNAARATFKPALDLSQRAWNRTMELNAQAFLVGSQLAAPLMREGGAIVGVSSLGSAYALPGYTALGAAKAAIEALARYLAVELAPRNINVNVVSAGFVDTESMRLSPDFDKLVDYVQKKTPAGRVAAPEDVAGLVAFLCSPDARWIYGQTLLADGGMSLVL